LLADEEGRKEEEMKQDRLRFAALGILLLAGCSGGHLAPGGRKTDWYPLEQDGEDWNVLSSFVDERLAPYRKSGVPESSVDMALSLGSCR
jgi:hypothetical protein